MAEADEYLEPMRAILESIRERARIIPQRIEHRIEPERGPTEQLHESARTCPKRIATNVHGRFLRLEGFLPQNCAIPRNGAQIHLPMEALKNRLWNAVKSCVKSH